MVEQGRLLKLELAVNEMQVEHRHTAQAITDIAKDIKELCEDMRKTTNHDVRILECERKLDVLNPVFTLIRYPKASLLLISSVYLFSIKETRDHLLILLKLL